MTQEERIIEEFKNTFSCQDDCDCKGEYPHGTIPNMCSFILSSLESYKASLKQEWCKKLELKKIYDIDDTSRYE